MNTTETKTENQKENSSADLPQYMLGRKQGMTQVFAEDGKVHPATKVAAGPLVVTQVKTLDTDGYQAYQFGFEKTNPESLTKPERGHQKEAFGGDAYFLWRALACA